MSEPNKELTYEEAVSMLPDGEEIHTFTQVGGIIMGCDHGRESVLVELKEAKKLVLAGKNARAMNHAIGMYRDTDDKDLDLMFIETKPLEE